MRRALAVLGVLVLASGAGAARAGETTSGEADADPAALFASATVALGASRPVEAIAKLEALSDRGIVDAALSYDRGLAYAERVRAGAEQPGDLGRAAHGFEEARSLTRDAALERDATHALGAVRAEIAKRRSRAGDSAELEHGVSLGRSIVGLVSENVWAVLASVFAAALTLGIVFRVRLGAGRARIAATTTCFVAAGLLAASALNVYYARDARLHLREGVVIGTTRLLDERHVALGGAAPVTEGARVTITDESGEFAHVVVGRVEGWLPASSVLPLAKR